MKEDYNKVVRRPVRESILKACVVFIIKKMSKQMFCLIKLNLMVRQSINYNNIKFWFLFQRK